jgi:hypothetical protein
MSDFVSLTEKSTEALSRLSELVPGVENEFLVETSLSITMALYEKASTGAVIRVEYADGKAEELRFKVKKPSRKKVKE